MDISSANPTPQMPTGKPSHKLKWSLITLAAVLVIIIVVWFVVGSKGSLGKVLGASTSSSGYQAVFLTNGQVYFGKLSQDGDWVDLTDIYYLQVTQNLQDASGGDTANATPSSTGTADQSQTNIQLVKLGSELHGPTDSMHIERDKVLFWEDMKDDSKVVAAIKQYQNK
ncbi:MAG TPA: hypothetical protein VFX17_00015 [Patescibacteria group bacterium]|nr:hypothetical protein [Patescibacteria group bacterium]